MFNYVNPGPPNANHSPYMYPLTVTDSALVETVTDLSAFGTIPDQHFEFVEEPVPLEVGELTSGGSPRDVVAVPLQFSIAPRAAPPTR